MADVELAIMRVLTTRLPRVKGSGRIPNILKRIYARKPRRSVIANVRGFRLALRPNEFVDGWLLFGPQFWDDDELRFVERNLPGGGVFLDVGAYIGLYALAAARAVGPTGRVLAIEANPRTFRELEANVERNSLGHVVRPLHVGVSDRSETLRLAHISDTNAAASSFIWHGTELEIGEGAAVHCRPLAEILCDEGIEHVDGAKFDIEGFEFRVLKEFFRTAAEPLFPQFMIVEHIPQWTTDTGNVVAAWAARVGGDTLELLADHGYRQVGQNSVNHIFVRQARRA